MKNTQRKIKKSTSGYTLEQLNTLQSFWEVRKNAGDQTAQGKLDQIDKEFRTF